MARGAKGDPSDSAIISGIQQLGIGVPDMDVGWRWYRKSFRVDVPVLIDAAEAPDMRRYTGGEVHSRRAALAVNLEGGGGFEVWQFTSRTPTKPDFEPELGDLGILVGKMKCRDIESAHRHLSGLDREILSSIENDLEGRPHFYLRDLYGNMFEVIQEDEFFSRTGSPLGGVVGVAIGVADMDVSVEFYRRVLGYDQVRADVTDTFSELKGVQGGRQKLRRVILTHSERRSGPFARLLGSTTLELIQKIEGTPRKVYADRYWGDIGFIHLCFDVVGMDALKVQCARLGHPFVVDSNDSFDMGAASGRFSYIEDPDGTLIEFVETHKIPVAKKLGLYLDLRKRKAGEPLSDWTLKLLGLARVRD